MNIRIDKPDHRLHEHFFRSADRMRLEGCVNALHQEGLSLALSCMHEALLDHHVQILLQRLRVANPQMAVEVYFPANTESLIARFNEALHNQSLHQATRGSSEVVAPQVWLVHDAQKLPPQELQLLARLIQNFPGANIRAILLTVGPASSQEALSAFGRKLLRWDIEGPSDEQAQAALELARHHGDGDAMQRLLRRIGQLRPESALATGHRPSETDIDAPALRPHSAKTAASETLPPLRPWRWPSVRWGRGASSVDRLQNLLKHPAFSLQRLRQRGPMLGVAAAALGLSVLIMMWIQPDAFGLKDKGRVAAMPSQAALKAVPVPAGAPAEAVETHVAAPLPQTDAASDAQAWVRGLSAQSFLIQHSTVATLDKAQQWLSANPGAREVRIVSAYRPGESQAHFVMVSGPYEAAGKAYERINKRDLPAGSWVRSTLSLQQQLAAPVLAKESR